jgi:hypothetical protein
MLRKIVDILFGCSHKFGFPIKRKPGARIYQVCLRCGAEYEYDWRQMRRIGPAPAVKIASQAPRINVQHSKVA